MADVKISALPVATTPLTGSEVLPIVQSGVTRQVSVDNLTAGKPIAASTLMTAAGTASAPSLTFSGDSNTGIYSPAADTIAFTEGGLEAMRITSAARVGIGTPAPGGRLAVTHDRATGGFSQIWTSFNGATFENDTLLSFDGSAARFGNFQAFSLAFLTNNLERVRISAVGFTTLTGSFGRGAPVTKTGNFTLADAENWIICNGAGTITVTFPAAASWTGREVMIKTIAAQTVVSASSNVVPLAGGAAGTSILPASAGAWATLVSDGANWVIMQS